MHLSVSIKIGTRRLMSQRTVGVIDPCITQFFSTLPVADCITAFRS